MLNRKPKIGDLIFFPTEDGYKKICNEGFSIESVNSFFWGTVTRIDKDMCYCDNNGDRCFNWRLYNEKTKDYEFNKLARILDCEQSAQRNAGGE